jgi:hypothetical protein
MEGSSLPVPILLIVNYCLVFLLNMSWYSWLSMMEPSGSSPLTRSAQTVVEGIVRESMKKREGKGEGRVGECVYI